MREIEPKLLAKVLERIGRTNVIIMATALNSICR